jgi:hypothetical protein
MFISANFENSLSDVKSGIFKKCDVAAIIASGSLILLNFLNFMTIFFISEFISITVASVNKPSILINSSALKS